VGALRVRGRLRSRDARRPHGEGALHKYLNWAVAAFAYVPEPAARPLRRRVASSRWGLLRARNRAADHPHLLHRLRAARGLGYLPRSR
jgi:hypothetical protein